VRARELEAREVAEAERPDRERDHPEAGQDRRRAAADPQRTGAVGALRGENRPLLHRGDLSRLYEINGHAF
jgi:hypothetical protein